MPKGSCDPSPDAFHVMTLTKGNGDVTVDIRYGWDGVSVYPNCVGPVLQIHYTNTGAVTWYARLPRKTRGQAFVAIPPGTDQTVTGNTLRQAGLDTLDAVTDLVLTTTPPA